MGAGLTENGDTAKLVGCDSIPPERFALVAECGGTMLLSEVSRCHACHAAWGGKNLYGAGDVLFGGKMVSGVMERGDTGRGELKSPPNIDAKDTLRLAETGAGA